MNEDKTTNAAYTTSPPPPPPEKELAHSLICIHTETGRVEEFIPGVDTIPVNGAEWFWWIIKNITIQKKMVPDRSGGSTGGWKPVLDYMEMWTTDIIAHTISKVRIEGQ